MLISFFRFVGVFLAVAADDRLGTLGSPGGSLGAGYTASLGLPDLRPGP